MMNKLLYSFKYETIIVEPNIIHYTTSSVDILLGKVVKVIGIREDPYNGMIMLFLEDEFTNTKYLINFTSIALFSMAVSSNTIKKVEYYKPKIESKKYNTIIYSDHNGIKKYGFIIRENFKDNYVYSVSDLSNKLKLYKNDIRITYSKDKSDIVFEKTCKVIIKSIEQSSKLFGRRIIKENMLNSKKKYNIKSIERDFICKKDNTSRNTILIYQDDGSCCRFLMDEVEIIYPNINIQLPKDRVLSEGKTCIIKDDRKLKLKKGDKVVINKVLNFTRTKNTNIIRYEVKKDKETFIVQGKNIKVY